jgi:transglutaminase-like putative cysteine protease
MMHTLCKLKSLIYVILVAFSWNSLGVVNYVHAFENGPARPEPVAESPWLKLNRALEQLDAVSKTIEESLKAGQDVTGPRADLQALELKIREIDAEIHQSYQAREQALTDKGLGGEILQRHRDAVAHYEQELGKLLSRLQAIEQAKNDQQLAGQVSALREWLQQGAHKPHLQHFDPENLPHRTPTVQPRPPATSKLELPEYRQTLPREGITVASLSPVSLSLTGQASATPQAQDLQETLEVKFTQEIQQLANSLGKNPVQIFEYVRNNFEYEPTYGSIKGAQGTLWSKAGNDFDLASLLIALLRTSGIPARYEYGTVELPIDKAMSWVGIDDPTAAGSLFSSGGIPATGITDSNNHVIRLQMEHVWVKAWVDYTPSRGAVFQAGDRWVRLDPSFKQHESINSVDFNAITSFDGQSFFNQLTAGATTGPYSATHVDPATIQNKVAELKTKLSDYLNNHPKNTMREVIGLSRPIIKAYGILPATANYDIKTLLNEYSEIPDYLRHKLTFQVASIDPLLGLTNTEFTYTASLPELAGRRITLSYRPADTATENYLNSLLPPALPNATLEQQIARLPTQIDASPVQLIPELKIDGTTVASGSAVGMGYDQEFDMNFSSPGGFNDSAVNNQIVAGTYNAVVLDLGAVSSDYIQQRRQTMDHIRTQLQNQDTAGLTKDDVIGETLHLAGIKYWTEVDLFTQIAQRVTGVAATRLPSEGIFSYNLKVVWGGIVLLAPQTIYDGGLGTDIDHDLQAVVSKDNDPARTRNYELMTGVIGSYMEASVYDEMLNYADQLPGIGISTAHILAYANSQGIPVYHINSSNVATVLPLLQVDNDVKNDIQTAVSAGKVVTIPERNLTINGWWTGVGYAVTDPGSGAGAYLISGGYAGGGFQLPTLHPLLLFLIGAVLTGIGIFAGLGLAIALAIAAILISLYDLISSSLPILDDPNLTPDEKDMIVGVLTGFFIIGAILAIAGIFFGSVLGFVAVAMLFLFLSIIASNIITSLAPVLARRRNQTGGSLRRRWEERLMLARIAKTGHEIREWVRKGRRWEERLMLARIGSRYRVVPDYGDQRVPA